MTDYPNPPSPAPLPARNLWPVIWVMAGLCTLLLAVLVYVVVSNGAEQRVDAASNVSVNAAAPDDRQAAADPVAAAPTMRSRPQAEQLATAFRTVFGRDGPVPRRDLGDGGTERASRMLWTSFGPVLLTESRLPDGCHACVGYIAAYYLRDTGSGFDLVSRHPEAVPGPGWGNPPEGWSIVDNFTTYPAIYAQGGYTGQGYTQTWASIVELRPDGPVESRVDLGSDNGGAVGEESPQSFSLDGEIRNVVRNTGFNVVYTGSCTVTRRYIRRGNKFVPEGGDEQDDVTCPGVEGSQ